MPASGVTPIVNRFAEGREALLGRLLDAQNRGDVEAALACFHHPRYELIGGNRVYDGPEQVRRYYDRVRRWFPDMRFEVIAVHHGADAVVSEMWMSGTHLGTDSDIEATGSSFRCRTAVIFVFEGELLVGARVYYDSGTIARQLA